MKRIASSTNKETKVIRRVARILSVSFIAILWFFFIGETFFQEHHEPITGNAILQLSITGISLLGLALAWWWESLGGALALTAYIILCFVNPMVLIPPLFPVPLSALLFLVCWWLDRRHDRRGNTVASH